jgi:hypothetical protein
MAVPLKRGSGKAGDAQFDRQDHRYRVGSRNAHIRVAPRLHHDTIFSCNFNTR